MKKNFINAYYIFLVGLLFALPSVSSAQVTLNADGPGNTYELINSVFAPGVSGDAAVENAECSTAHPSFGRHIAEIWDADLMQYVFEFYIHRDYDNDRCIATTTDRQRVEIKTYESSPDNLKGTLGETVTYKWKFKIPSGFQPSSNFTHIHQVKPVNGDDGNPIFTITLRKGTPNKLEVNYYNAATPNVSTKIVNVNLSSFENTWVEATETVKVGDINNGTYSMVIKRVSDNFELVNFKNSSSNIGATIATIRPDNSFIRPKWGIYRSLLSFNDLRDEALRFANISIQEGAVVPIELSQFEAKAQQKSILLTWKTESEKDNDVFNIEYATNGKDFEKIGQVKGFGTTNTPQKYSFEHTSTPSVKTHYYRLKQVDFNGQFSYSPVRSVVFGKTTLNVKTTLVHDVLDIETQDGAEATISIFNTVGQQVLTHKGQGTQRISVSHLPIGTYIIRTNTGEEGRFVKQ